MNDFSFYRNETKVDRLSVYNHPDARMDGQKGIVKKVLKLPVIFYQRLISDQLQPNCIFTPSCSQFGVECIKEYGIFKGMLLTGDRMMRCSIMNYPYYFIRPIEDGKICDHVSIYK